MSVVEYQTRRIFRSSATSRDVVRELLQIMWLAELLSPSDEVWLVSPWVSDFVLLDNRSSLFNSVNPHWNSREIRLVDYVVQLMISGTKVIVVTGYDPHNSTFLGRLKDRVVEAGVEENIEIYKRKKLHTKGILTSGGVLMGSMNLTYNGLELNEESVFYETSLEAVAKARVEFQSYRQESA